MGSSSDRQRSLLGKVEGSIEGEVVPYTGVEPNPSTATVDRGAEALKASGADYVIALGGGSVIDAAKAISIVASQGGCIMDYLKGTKTPAGLGHPLIAIPTTPGTSSEITPFSIITSESDRNKLGLRHPSMFPSLALIDPSLTVSLPQDQTASTGLDIMAHAFESYWAVKASPLTRDHALSSVSLLGKHLEKAHADGGARPDREGVSMASVHAGLSFSNTGTTVCHALSYPITYDTGLPHGMACALSLPGTYRIVAERRPDLAGPLAYAFGCGPKELPLHLKQMMERLGVPTSLEGLGFDGGYDRIARTPLSGFVQNMSIQLTDADMGAIYRSMLDGVN
jgi:alcohol dehydrogenase class IV